MIKKTFKLISLISVVALIFFGSAGITDAVICGVSQGCTGVNTITGIPYGTGTSPLSIVTIGSGLSFSGGTLSATGGGTGTVTSLSSPNGTLTIGSPTTTPTLDVNPASNIAWTGAETFVDGASGFGLYNLADSTKQATFSLASLATGVHQVITLPNATGATMATLNLSQTFSNTQTFSGNVTMTTGTLVLGNSTGTQTISIGNSVTNASTTKTVNIGTGGASTSISNINIGSVTSGALGTFQLNSPTVNVATLSSGGLVKAASSTGTLSIATAGTDYLASASTDATLTGNGLAATPLGLNLSNSNTWLAEQQVTSTSGAQLQLNYDGTHDAPFTVNSSGNLTIAPTGTNTNITGVLNVSSSFTTINNAANIYIGSTAGATTQSASQFQYAGSSTNFLRNAFNGTTSTTLTTGANYSGTLFASAPITTFTSGTHPWLSNVVVNPLGTVTAGGAAITNTASLYIGGASSSGTNNFSLYVASGNAQFGGRVVVPSGIQTDASGSATSNAFLLGGNTSGSTSNSSLLFGGASTINYRSFFNGSTTSTIATGTNYANVIMGSTPVSTPSTGSVPWVTNLAINAPGTITNGGVTPTNTAALYIDGASTAGTNNFAININSGAIGLAGSAGTSGQVLTSQGAGTTPIWSTIAGTGTVTSVATDSTLTGGTITTSGTLGINLANANVWTASGQTFFEGGMTVNDPSGARAPYPFTVVGTNNTTGVGDFGVMGDVQLGTTTNNTIGFQHGQANTSGTVQTTAGWDFIGVSHTVGAQSTSIAWATRNAGSFGERMRLLYNGNFSIGSTSGASMFNVGTSNQFQVTSTGVVSTTASITTPVVKNTATQTVVSCSTSGSVTFSEPEQGSSYKLVLAYENACLGTATYTFPTAFTNTPDNLGINAAKFTSISTTATTVTGATTSGFSQLYGY